MRRAELRRINKEWKDVENVEQRALLESRGDGADGKAVFFGIPAVARRLMRLGRRLAGRQFSF
jgi:hypothetical protein